MIHASMFQKHIHKVKFYPSADDFTQALLVMLVTNIMSVNNKKKLAPFFVIDFSAFDEVNQFYNNLP